MGTLSFQKLYTILETKLIDAIVWFSWDWIRRSQSRLVNYDFSFSRIDIVGKEFLETK